MSLCTRNSFRYLISKSFSLFKSAFYESIFFNVYNPSSGRYLYFVSFNPWSLMLRKDHEDENQTLETGHVALEMSGKLAQIVSKHEVTYYYMRRIETWWRNSPLPKNNYVPMVSYFNLLLTTPIVPIWIKKTKLQHILYVRLILRLKMLKGGIHVWATPFHVRTKKNANFLFRTLNDRWTN